MTVVPGFIDCHNHAGGEVLLYEVLVGNPFEVEFVTILSIVDKLKAKAQQTPPGTWVEGYFFDDTKVKDKRALNIRDLDEVSSEHPVVVRHRGGHTYFYNSKAFELAGVTKDTPNPMGGTFDRDDERRAERPRHRPRLGRVRQGRHPADVHRGADRAARARRPRAHLQAVRPLRPDQRAPPGRRPAGDAGRARPRRAAAPRQLRDERRACSRR